MRSTALAISSKPSSCSRLKTGGLITVEQMIHLGERCLWVTQKTEYVWFYTRALDEHFYFTLLCVRNLFDLPALVPIFKNHSRKRGTGPFSRALIGNVMMVNKITKLAARPDDGGEHI